MRRDGAPLLVTDAARGTVLARRMLLSGDGEVRLRLIADLDLAETRAATASGRRRAAFSPSTVHAPPRCEAEPPPQVALASANDPYAVLTWRAEDRLGVELTCVFGRGEPPPGVIATATAADRRWLAAGRELGPGAPGWARELHDRSLLALRALTDPRTGAMAAGLREAWAYVWPRDAGTAALAFAESGHPEEARAVARFLSSLDLAAGARFQRRRNGRRRRSPCTGRCGRLDPPRPGGRRAPGRHSDRAGLARAARLRRAQR